MKRFSQFYLIRIQYLGFRYHGWAKQGNLKTVHLMIDRTLNYVLGHDQFKTLGCGRTDAMVSAEDYVFELFVNDEIESEPFLKDFNENLPADIRALSISETDERFNVIQSARTKEYHYHFSFGPKSHPFSAPYIAHFNEELDIESMKKATQYFLGNHNFRRFVSKPSNDAVLERTMIKSELKINKDLKSSFFPNSSYVFKIAASGFLRYQVRLMVGALRDVGQGIIAPEFIQEALSNPDGEPFVRKAPASGLVLHQVSLDH